MVYLEYTGGIIYARDVSNSDAGTQIVVDSSYGHGFTDATLHGTYTIADNNNIENLKNHGNFVITTLVTDMKNLFRYHTSFNQDIGKWDVSNVTTMHAMFNNSTSFNQDIGKWNVSSVTDMNSMFRGATIFNHDIGDWDVSNVTTMSMMFNNASEFNQDIGRWTVSNVTTMNSMFFGASDFNQDIGDWDVSNVIDMHAMFKNASDFNQDIGRWTVNNVRNMSAMFNNATAFNQNIRDWNVSNVTTMHSMFYNTTEFNIDIGDWDVSNVTTMSIMFLDSGFNQDIGRWDVSSVTDMSSMFKSALNFNQDIGDWNVSNVTNMRQMFFGAIAFNQDIGGWNVYSVTDMIEMFRNATSFNQNIRYWNVGTNTIINNMFMNVNIFLNGQYGTSTGYINNDGNVTDISNYFNQPFLATSSGDPHVFPVYGNPYELPPKPGIYRMLQGHNLIVNASTRKIYCNERSQIQKYFKALGAPKAQIQKLVDDGCFYHKVSIFCDNMMFYYDFDNKKVKFANKASSKYFKIRTNISSNLNSSNQYEKCESVASVIVSFVHETYGPLTMRLNYFSNPQIKYGLIFSTYNIEDLSGLLIREYDIPSMTIDNLDNTCEKIGIIGKNSITTQLIIL